MINALSVDVEECYDASEIQRRALPSDVFESRVEAQTATVLELLEQHEARATFFILGSVAARCPAVVRSIVAAGHEIGCHSFAHKLIYELTPDEFRQDTYRAKASIEDACGIEPQIYRAPSYSITEKSLWALEILVELGFTHDSSIYPIRHDRYGIPGACRHAHEIRTCAGSIYEIPVATVKLSEKNIAPIGGGGYLRLFPYRYTAAGIRRVNGEEHQPVCVYFHPWELDPKQPHLARGVIAKLRTHMGVRSMAGKIERLLQEFRFDAMRSVYGQGLGALRAGIY